MAKSPDRPQPPQRRDPAKHSKKDPAKPTHAKAARPDTPSLDPSLADLLNPGIGQGRAGIGAQTGIQSNKQSIPTPNPSAQEEGERQLRDQQKPRRGLQPPADNSWDRRADFAEAHRARASIARGFNEPPQQSYVCRMPVSPGEIDPDLARALGIEEDGAGERHEEPRAEGGVIKYGDESAARSRSARHLQSDAAQGAGLAYSSAASQQSLDRLLREGRPEFREHLWTPHRPPRPEKTEGGRRLAIQSDFDPKGDQPQAIRELVEGVRRNDRSQVLLGVTGSGKTFTMAKAIEQTQRPALILAPNKTLAAQLYGEFKGFFPDNAVEYFVSYYDYYQPEAYIPRTDTYIEKDSSINEQIDRMRHSATRALLERDDVIIVASVSCIYGIGSVETYTAMTFALTVGERIDQRQLLADLVALQYRRTDMDFRRGSFRVRGDTVDLFPAHLEDRAWRITLFGDEIESIVEFDPLTGEKTATLGDVVVYANSHYVTPRPTMQGALQQIKTDLKQRLDEFNRAGRLLEAQRLEQRTLFDIEMLETTGSCAGIENYSRYLTGRRPGEPPPTLFEYFPESSLLIVDESHVTVPQIGGMFRGDFNRKSVLAEFGFRLPSAIDNRPLKFEEWETLRPQTAFVSATPGPWEMERTQGIFIEQVIRPTGLIDPTVI